MLAWIVLYVAVQIAIGVWISRRVKSTADLVLAGRSLGAGLVGFAVFATFFGAEAIVGTSGAVYEKGLAGMQSDPIGYAIALLLVGVLMAARLRAGNYVTFADMFRLRYSPLVERLVVLVLLPGSVFWAAAQIRAFGQVVGAASGLSITTAMAIGVVAVVAYTVLGGVLADAWSDVLQSVVIVLGLGALLAIVAGKAGGLGQALAAVPPERLAVFATGEEGWLGLAERLAVPIFGTMVAVEVISLALSARGADAARTGCLIGAALYLVIGAIPAFIGLIGASLVPGVEEAEQVVPKLAETVLPPIPYVLFVGAVISAIMSTVSTIFMASSAQVTQNLVRPSWAGITDGQQLAVTRLVLVLLALVALLIAMRSDNVKSLVETASAAGSSGVVVVALFALFTRLGGALAAVTAILAGSLGWLGLTQWTEFAAPYLAALALASVSYVAVSLFERRGADATHRPAG